MGGFEGEWRVVMRLSGMYGTPYHMATAVAGDRPACLPCPPSRHFSFLSWRQQRRRRRRRRRRRIHSLGHSNTNSTTITITTTITTTDSFLLIGARLPFRNDRPTHRPPLRRSLCDHSLIQETPCSPSLDNSILAGRVLRGYRGFNLPTLCVLCVFVFDSVAFLWPGRNALKFDLNRPFPRARALCIMVRSLIVFAALASVASVYAQAATCSLSNKCPVDTPCCSRKFCALVVLDHAEHL